MTEEEVRRSAFAMPLVHPAYPPGPYRFINREFFIITYRSDPEALQRLIPAPLEIVEPVARFEFIRMPDTTGFGDYTESGQVIPVLFQGQVGGYTLAMYLDDHPPIAGGHPRLRLTADRDGDHGLQTPDPEHPGHAGPGR